MALILNEKYNSYLLFISNRFLRLFPVYWVVAGLTLIISLAFLLLNGDASKIQPFIDNFENMNIGSIVFIIFTNLFIFGQDAVMFMKLNAGSLVFTPDFISSSPRVHRLLLVPQAWTLGVELIFYLIAPFLVKRSARISASSCN